MTLATIRATMGFFLVLTTLAPAALVGEAPHRSLVVRMTADHTFDPQVLIVRPGDEVVWRNEDRGVHSVVGDPLLALHRSDVEPPEPPEPFHLGDIEAGGSFRHAFSLEGVYRYVCTHHEEQGMNGVVIVEGAGNRPSSKSH